MIVTELSSEPGRVVVSLRNDGSETSYVGVMQLILSHGPSSEIRDVLLTNHSWQRAGFPNDSKLLAFNAERYGGSNTRPGFALLECFTKPGGEPLRLDPGDAGPVVSFAITGNGRIDVVPVFSVPPGGSGNVQRSGITNGVSDGPYDITGEFIGCEFGEQSENPVEISADEIEHNAILTQMILRETESSDALIANLRGLMR